MRHTFIAEGFGARLRPVRRNDASFIVWLRGLDHAKGKLGDTATTVGAQESWLESYFDRDGEYYFMVETSGGISLGTTSIYNLNGDSAEFGRLIISPGVPAALPSSVLSNDLAFDRLGLKELRATSVGSNRTLHSFIKKLGYRQTGIALAARMIAGQVVDIFNFALTAADWYERRPHLIPLAEFAGRQVAAWENTEQKQTQYGTKSM